MSGLVDRAFARLESSDAWRSVHGVGVTGKALRGLAGAATRKLRHLVGMRSRTPDARQRSAHSSDSSAEEDDQHGNEVADTADPVAVESAIETVSEPEPDNEEEKDYQPIDLEQLEFHDISDGEDDDGDESIQARPRNACIAAQVLNTMVNDGETKMLFLNPAYLVRDLPSITDATFVDTFTKRAASTPWFRQLVEQVINGGPNTLCTSDTKRLLPHQLTTHAYFVHMANLIKTHREHYDKHMYRGTLVFQSTGSGKTAVQMGLVSAFHSLIASGDAVIRFITTKLNAETNTMSAFAEWACMYTNFCRMTKEEAIQEMKRIGMRDDDSGKHSSSWLTYHKFYNRSTQAQARTIKPKPGQLEILVLDEAHSLFKKFKSADNIEAKRWLYQKYLPKRGRNTIVILLTATPGLDVGDVMQLMSMTEWIDGSSVFAKERFVTSDNELIPGAIQRFQQLVSGRVTHVDMRRIMAMFPKRVVQHVTVPHLSTITPKGKQRTPYPFEYSGKKLSTSRQANDWTHQEKYIQSLHDALDAVGVPRAASITKRKQQLQQPEKAKSNHKKQWSKNQHNDEDETLMSGAPASPTIKTLRRASQMASIWTSALRLGEGACACSSNGGCPILNGKKISTPFEKREHLERVALKLLKVIDNINAYPTEKHFVYADTNQVARAFVCAMHHMQGFKVVSSAELERVARGGALGNLDGSRAVLTMTSDMFPEDVLELWNRRDNWDGRHFSVLVASGSGMQGLDLKDTRIMHQIGELPEVAATLQLDGRAVRNCSLKNYINRSAADVKVEDKMVVTKFVYTIALDSDPAALVAEAVRETKEELAVKQANLQELERAAENYTRLQSHVVGENAVYGQSMLARRKDDYQRALDRLKMLPQNLDGKIDPSVAQSAGVQQMARELQAYKDAYSQTKAQARAVYERLHDMEAQIFEGKSGKAIKDMIAKLQQQVASLRQRVAEETEAAKAMVDMGTIDTLVRKYALKKFALLEVFYQALRQSAFDCELLQDINVTVFPGMPCKITDISKSTVLNAYLKAEDAVRIADARSTISE